MKTKLTFETMNFILDIETKEIIAVIRNAEQAKDAVAYFKGEGRDVESFTEEVAVGTEEDWG